MPMKTKASMRRRSDVWVIRHRAGYAVKRERRPTCAPVLTQRDAMTIGRIIARALRAELVVQGRNGRIRIKHSHGQDQYPPKG